MATETAGSTSTSEVLVGNRSGRIFEARIEISDDAKPATLTYVVHYEATTVSPP